MARWGQLAAALRCGAVRAARGRAPPRPEQGPLAALPRCEQRVCACGTVTTARLSAAPTPRLPELTSAEKGRSCSVPHGTRGRATPGQAAPRRCAGSRRGTQAVPSALCAGGLGRVSLTQGRGAGGLGQAVGASGTGEREAAELSPEHRLQGEIQRGNR